MKEREIKKDINLKNYKDLQNKQDNKIFDKKLELKDELLINWGYRQALQDGKKMARKSLKEMYKRKNHYICLLRDKTLTGKKRNRYEKRLEGISAIISFLTGFYNLYEGYEK